MPENMNISVNGQSRVPPGFRFHPTEEELLHYYLRKKISYEKIDLDVIPDVDLNKLEPWDIQEKCKIGTTPQNDWYFFSHKDKKYPTGTRTNRATTAGFWKATGRDKVILSNGRRIGMRKTLVFYKGRAPHGQKSDWIMHEYRLDDNNTSETNVPSNVLGVEATQEEGWVVCRVFKKKNLHKTLDSPRSSTISGETGTGHHMYDSCNEGALEQILQHMSTSTTTMICKEETTANNNYINNHLRFSRPIMETSTGIHINGCIYNNDPFLKLPSLESPNSTSNNNNNSQNCYKPMIGDSSLTSWAAFDQLVASQLNGQNETSRQLACFNDPTTMAYTTDNDDHLHDFHQLMPTLRSSSSLSSNRSYHGGSEDYNSSEIDLWNFTRSSSSLSSSDLLCHVSNTSV
ncbi:hypothetical protein Dsin_025842 [Dipteronia sinensis]|uniref:NAC domain-containing protein n=1 Tax=Dipteronia sinensis TaxID=43782 RepID=A0AAD9ZX31_9ROSI|nr:hypothetical protein Dsin_025842 [Dipteronia sinensis]